MMTFRIPSRKNFWSGKKDESRKHVWQPQLYLELSISVSKMGTACTVHGFQYGSVLNEHE